MKALQAFMVIAIMALVVAVPLFAQNVVDVTGQSGSVKEIEVSSTGLRFSPNEIRVNLGDTLRITYRNGGGRHDWVIDEFDAATPVIAGGQSATVEFVADRAGTFEFYCSVSGHRAAGMVGALVVVE
ncbi:MAG: hypothetical protein EA384_12620 [Spirochaetaceae bacterium]|nr:MAG: hypothetical protein EA384_12620 [Spirochaetaceae bacterium]